MNTKLYFIFFLMASLSFNSCSTNERGNQDLNGEYVGIFTVTYLSGETYTNPVTVVFNGENKYQSSGNSDYFPAGGSGTFDKTDSTMTFSDINIWTANFDWHLVLNGEYDYLLDGNALTISAFRNDFGTYTYKLIKE